MLGQERGRHAAGAHRGMDDEPAKKREVRRHAGDLGLGERLAESLERLVPRRAARDQLRDHRVVGGADLVALLDARVDANVRGQPEPLDPPRLRQERVRVLRIEPSFHSVPGQVTVCYLHGFAVGNS